MVMANRSILVVGGKMGLITPKPPCAGLVYCVWLNRTDPTISILPWQFCLPAVPFAYYNEARVLDEKTFQTTSVMPNIPGAVNDTLVGQTYPLEGYRDDNTTVSALQRPVDRSHLRWFDSLSGHRTR